MLAMVRLVMLAVAILIAHAPVQTALAHASLISSQPEDGVVLAASPQRVILIFNEPVSPLRMQLIDRSGKAMPLTDIVQHDSTVILPISGPLEPGTHALSWRVVSTDGHPVGGTVVFSIGQADAEADALQTQAGQTLRTAIWVVRVAVFIVLFFGVGGAVFANCMTTRPLPGQAENVIAGACIAGLVLLLLAAGLQGLDALDMPLSALADAEVWQAGFSTTFGTTVSIAILACAIALLSMRSREPEAAWPLSLAALVALGCALAASGHAAAASPQWIMRPAVWLHTVAIAIWVGSLWPLGQLLRSDPAPSIPALRRFSAVIPWFIGALVVSGSVLAVIQLARVNALWTTNYGIILSIKLAAVAALLALAAANRFLLTPKVVDGDTRARQHLRWSITAEIALIFFIFVMAAGWRFTPPPRSIVADVQTEFVHFHTGTVMADITLTPGRTGRSSGEIVIRDGNYQPMMPKGVTLVFSQPASGIEPLRREAVSIGEQRWRVDDVMLPTSGRWRLRVEVLIDDFQKEMLEDDILIRP